MECSFLSVVISLSLNDSAHNILNDVLKIYGLVKSLLFNGFSVFGGFLVSVILSSVTSPTGGMVMSFSSAVFDIHLTNVFNIIIIILFKSFHKQNICHWATASIVVADGFAVLAFWRILHHSLLMGSFVSKFCSHS